MKSMWWNKLKDKKTLAANTFSVQHYKRVCGAVVLWQASPLWNTKLWSRICRKKILTVKINIAYVPEPCGTKINQEQATAVLCTLPSYKCSNVCSTTKTASPGPSQCHITGHWRQNAVVRRNNFPQDKKKEGFPTANFIPAAEIQLEVYVKFVNTDHSKT